MVRVCKCQVIRSSPQGIIFSVNSRNSRRESISLELMEDGRARLAHSAQQDQDGDAGAAVVDLPTRLADGRWHQMAIRWDVVLLLLLLLLLLLFQSLFNPFRKHAL